jgi:hypothetical protein
MNKTLADLKLGFCSFAGRVILFIHGFVYSPILGQNPLNPLLAML